MKRQLSVIVPVYNTEQYIRQCIESIQRQSLKNIEIILVDDGSTDYSGKICDEYELFDNRIRVLHQENQGPIASRALGLEYAKSEYVTFVDSDDFIDEKSFELAVSDMEKGIDVISFGIIRYSDTDNRKYVFSKYEVRKYVKNEIQEKIFPSMIWDINQDTFGLDPSLCTKIIKTELAKNTYAKLENVSFHYGEDMAVFYPLLLSAESLTIYNKAYYNHRQRFVNEVARYFKDEYYFEKLFELYEYLKNTFKDYSDLRKQIDLFYIKSTQYGLKKYGLFGQKNKYIFPFDKVKKGEGIVLYGAGTVGHTYWDQLSKLDYCEVVLWVDKNFSKYNDKRIRGLEEIRKYSFDKVIIALAKSDMCGVVKNTLLDFGIEERDIII